MDRSAHEPLTPEEAKARLRAAARRSGPAAWVQHRPRQVLAVALFAGFIIGSSGTGKQSLLARTLLRLLL